MTKFLQGVRSYGTLPVLSTYPNYQFSPGPSHLVTPERFFQKLKHQLERGQRIGQGCNKGVGVYSPSPFCGHDDFLYKNCIITLIQHFLILPPLESVLIALNLSIHHFGCPFVLFLLCQFNLMKIYQNLYFSLLYLLYSQSFFFLLFRSGGPSIIHFLHNCLIN